jgi:hypothetical protein
MFLHGNITLEDLRRLELDDNEYESDEGLDRNEEDSDGDDEEQSEESEESADDAEEPEYVAGRDDGARRNSQNTTVDDDDTVLIGRQQGTTVGASPGLGNLHMPDGTHATVDDDSDTRITPRS